MRVLITGASGFLGGALMAEAAAWGIETIAISRHRSGGAGWVTADLLDAAAVGRVLEQHRPDAVISAAAANPGSADDPAVNEAGAAAVARAAASIGARMVHVSTDVVHAGHTRPADPSAPQPPYADDATPSPLNAYGASKAAGEQAVRAAHGGSLIVRTSLLFDPQRIDRGTQGFIDRLGRGERLSLWSDAIRQPIGVATLASALLDLAVELPDVEGFLNVAGNDALSRAEFALRLLAHWEIDPGDRYDLSSAADLGNQPVDLRLNLDRARRLGVDLGGVSTELRR